MKVLILAAGFGVRLREIIHGRPKHLAPINGQPFLRLLLRMLKKNGVTKVIISIGYLGKFIVDEFKHDTEGLKIIFLEDNRPLGTAGSLIKAKKYFKDDFFVINGDTYLDIDYKKLMTDHKKSKSLLTIVGTSAPGATGSVILSKNNQVTRFISHSPAPKSIIGTRNAGVYCLSPKIFKFIPSDVKVSLEKETIPLLLSKKKLVSSFSTKKAFIDIGSPQAYQKAQNKLK